MQKKQRILVVEEDSLFSNGVKLLLARRENLEIIGAAPTDLRILTAEIERTQPDVVIINDDLSNANPHLILTLLKTYPDLRLITLNLEGNYINMYNHREIAVTTSDDLVAAIAGNG